MLIFSNNEDIAEVSDFEIDEFERNIGVSLPGQYRQFLLEVRGGFPSRDWAPFDEGGDYISHFYGLKSDVAWKMLDYGIREFGSPSETGYLPVAICNGGNYFLLRIRDPEVGSVFFWDHDEEDFEPPSFESLYRVGSTFDEFTASLELPPDNG